MDTKVIEKRVVVQKLIKTVSFLITIRNVFSNETGAFQFFQFF